MNSEIDCFHQKYENLNLKIILRWLYLLPVENNYLNLKNTQHLGFF